MSRLAEALAPDPAALAVAVAIDLALGDPAYAAHPVRLVGRSLQWGERRLRAFGFDGYGGGILLFVGLALAWLALLAAVMALAGAASPVRLKPDTTYEVPSVVRAAHTLILYTLLAFGDLLRHVWRIESAVRVRDLPAARLAVGRLVGRDTDRMDGATCRRAAVESLSESVTDGFVSPIFWYVVGGLPGIVLFKIVSTMDSMVGYSTPQYLRFGWCGARLDDVLNYVPARLTWFVVAAVAWVLPGLSGRKAWRIGLQQHAIVPGPNAGWSEAAAAGALGRRIAGPIWLRGVLVNDAWIGDPADPPLESAGDVGRAMALALAAGLTVAALGLAWLRW